MAKQAEDWDFKTIIPVCIFVGTIVFVVFYRGEMFMTNEMLAFIAFMLILIGMGIGAIIDKKRK